MITLNDITTSNDSITDMMLFTVLLIGNFYGLSSVMWLLYGHCLRFLLLDLPGRVIRLPSDRTVIFQLELQPITSARSGSLCWMRLARSVSLFITIIKGLLVVDVEVDGMRCWRSVFFKIMFMKEFLYI